MPEVKFEIAQIYSNDQIAYTMAFIKEKIENINELLLEHYIAAELALKHFSNVHKLTRDEALCRLQKQAEKEIFIKYNV